ncbi:MAG: hypothetical protein V3U30_05055 [Thermoplasmata archaeon]
MSLTGFIRHDEVAALLDCIVPPVERPQSRPMLAPPRTTHYRLVGTAFDYALRFELQRRNDHAVGDTWVAETALPLLGKGIPVRIAGDAVISQEALTRRATTAVREAKAFHKEYLREVDPTPDDRKALAVHALRLAGIDPVYRAGVIAEDFDGAHPGDVEDLIRLLDVVPWEQLGHPETLLLNPTFGRASGLVGGADADLISGDLLIDVKTTKRCVVDRRTLHQLLGYFLLTRLARREEPSFSEVSALGVYLSRHGLLWTFPTEPVTSNPAFPEVERTFVVLAVALEYGGPFPDLKREALRKTDWSWLEGLLDVRTEVERYLRDRQVRLAEEALGRLPKELRELFD